jgi:ankyrin repeat protein
MDQFEAAGAGDSQQLRGLLTTHNVDDVGWAGYTALHYAASNGHVVCAKVCVEMGANVNARDDLGYTPLHVASEHVEVASVLLDAGAIMDVTYDRGWTPLYHAFYVDQVDMARFLIDRGARISNVKLDKYFPAIPHWVNTYIASRSRCRTVSIIIIGIHKYHRTNITGNNDINVSQLISKHIWSTRMDDVWSQASSGLFEWTAFNNCVSF